MKLYTHPVSTTSRPVMQFIADKTSRSSSSRSIS